MLDSTHETIIWHDFDEEVTLRKRQRFWKDSDPNRECVFMVWNGVDKQTLFTNHCDIPAKILCMSLIGKTFFNETSSFLNSNFLQSINLSFDQIRKKIKIKAMTPSKCL